MSEAIGFEYIISYEFLYERNKKTEIRNNISQFFYSINMLFEKDYIEYFNLE